MSRPSNLTLQQWLNLARRSCSTRYPQVPELIASKVLKLNKTQLLTESHIKLTKKQLAKLNNLLGKILAGRPPAAVLGSTDFYNLKLKVNSHVLAPRPETEQLIEFAAQSIPPNSKVLDIGCGSGAIGLSLAKARPDLSLILSDISSRALSLARINLAKNKISTSSVSFKRTNLIKKFVQKDLLEDLRESFFLANLPYVSKSWPKLNKKSLAHEPSTALFAQANGTQVIHNLVASLSAHKLLTNKNWLLIEHDPRQLQNLQQLCQNLSLNLEKISNYISKISAK